MSKINWIEINSINEVPKSKDNNIVIFKHSPRCIISKIIFKRFELAFNRKLNIHNYIYIDVVRMKGLSNVIADKYNVFHESPQLILINNDKVLYHTSHSDINFSSLNDHIT